LKILKKLEVYLQIFLSKLKNIYFQKSGKKISELKKSKNKIYFPKIRRKKKLLFFKLKIFYLKKYEN